MSKTITGARVLVYINGDVYNECQSISLDIDYSESEIYGIDSVYVQEIAPGKVSVRGSINGLRTTLSGGLQAKNMRPLALNILTSPYISLRIVDRLTSEDIIFIPQCKVTREKHQTGAKQKYSLSFDFVGVVPLLALDRS